MARGERKRPGRDGQGNVDGDGIAVLLRLQLAERQRDILKGCIGGEAEQHHGAVEDELQTAVFRVTGVNELHGTSP